MGKCIKIGGGASTCTVMDWIDEHPNEMMDHTTFLFEDGYMMVSEYGTNALVWDSEEEIGNTPHKLYNGWERIGFPNEQIWFCRKDDRGIYITFSNYEVGTNPFRTNESKNTKMHMNKKTIRLTESDLHRIIKESVNRVLNEGTTIQRMAQSYDCEEPNEYGLADIWAYWLACDTNDQKSLRCFKMLNRQDRQRMLSFLKSEPAYSELFDHIVSNIY